jgi:biotin operon repressor
MKEKNPCDKSRANLKYNIKKLEELGYQCEE